MTQTIELMDQFFQSGDLVVGVAATAFLFVLGSVVASFSGLVAYRLKTMDPDMSAMRAISFPPSHCESCGRRLRFSELVPVFGWFVAGGRCSHCETGIPAGYPATELLLGAYVAALPFMLGGIQIAVAPILLTLLSFLIAAIDWENAMVPEELTWILLFSGLSCAAFEADTELRIYGAALGGALAWLMTTLPGWLKGADTRAWGDVAMAAGVGAWLGIFAVVPVLVFAAIVQFAAGIALRTRLARHTPEGEDGIWIPFGPALMTAFAAGLPAYPLLREMLAP